MKCDHCGVKRFVCLMYNCTDLNICAFCSSDKLSSPNSKVSISKLSRNCRLFVNITLKQYVTKGGFGFVFFIYLKWGYHHIYIFQENLILLGSSWIFNNVERYFVFTILPFGLGLNNIYYQKHIWSNTT